MTRELDRQQLTARNEIVAAPAPRACTDQSFELPGGLYAATALLFFGFVSVLSLAFMGPTMVIPYAICIAFIAAFFAVPAIFVRAGPEEARARALGWAEFRENGIATATGRTPALEAATLVLLLPALIFCWGVAVATIAAAA